jgi:hypothetical protein
MSGSTPSGESSLTRAQRWIETLVTAIGPRRPASMAERTASEWLRTELERHRVDASLEPFPAHSTFAAPYGVLLALALAPALVSRRAQGVRSALASGAALLGALEDGLRLRPLTRLTARSKSFNLVATLEPDGEPRRTLCLVSHVDSSRSGALFSAPLAPHLRPLLGGLSLALGVQGLEPMLARTHTGRRIACSARALLALGLVLLAERELRGVDVPGANDNASGAALTAALTAETAAARLDSTRLVLLVTGAEEAGLLGSDAFLRRRETRDWIFLNFDGVAAPATLRFLRKEGLLRSWDADPGLVAVAERLAARRPELGLAPADVPAGLTYDATPVLARGGRALTISAQDGTIPHYHRSTDDVRNVDADTLTRALEVGRELISAIDRGECDR